MRKEPQKSGISKKSFRKQCVPRELTVSMEVIDSVNRKDRDRIAAAFEEFLAGHIDGQDLDDKLYPSFSVDRDARDRMVSAISFQAWFLYSDIRVRGELGKCRLPLLYTEMVLRWIKLLRSDLVYRDVSFETSTTNNPLRIFGVFSQLASVLKYRLFPSFSNNLYWPCSGKESWETIVSPRIDAHILMEQENN